jgi:hypothetical protein
MLKHSHRCCKQLVIWSVALSPAQRCPTKEDERQDAVDADAIEDRYDEVSNPKYLEVSLGCCHGAKRDTYACRLRSKSGTSESAGARRAAASDLPKQDYHDCPLPQRWLDEHVLIGGVLSLVICDLSADLIKFCPGFRITVIFRIHMQFPENFPSFIMLVRPDKISWAF